MKKYQFTISELVDLLDNNPINCGCTNVDKQLDLERHFQHTGKEPVHE